MSTNVFYTVCVLILIKLRWQKKKSLFDSVKLMVCRSIEVSLMFKSSTPFPMRWSIKRDLCLRKAEILKTLD